VRLQRSLRKGSGLVAAIGLLGTVGGRPLATHPQVNETSHRSGRNPDPSQVVTDPALITGGE
jgi:hypothetical protein